MAASASCNSVGTTIEKLAGRLVHQGPSNSADGSQMLHGDYKMTLKRTEDQGGHIRSSASFSASSTQASRFASIVVAATAWAGLSMCSPIEALATAYEGERHQNVRESVIFMPTSMLHLGGDAELPEDVLPMGEFGEEQSKAEMEATIGKAPSIKPPNEGSNSPWLPKTIEPRKTASMRCPKWTESELEMVLPDLQGRPKPFPRMQGHLYPFWPATASLIEKGDAHDTRKHSTLPSSPTPPQQLHMPIIKKLRNCFTM